MVPDLERIDGHEEVPVRVLRDGRRLDVVRVLRDADGPLVLADLAEELVERERTDSSWGTDAEDVHRCKVDLYHRHVPKLAEADVVEFDPDQQTVALAE